MNEKLTIIQINALGSTTSTGRTTREMHNYFLERGFQSFIATACNKDCDDAFPISSMFWMHLDVLLTMLTGKEASHSTLQTLRLIQYIKKIRPDVVHLRIIHNSYINLRILLKYLAKNNIATVVTLHDMWYLTGHCCYYHLLNCDRWKTGCHDCPEIKDMKRKPLFDRTKGMWEHKREGFGAIEKLAVIGNSQWTTNEAKKSILRDARIVKCIYNWIDFNVFYPREASQLRIKLKLQNKKIIIGVSVYWSLNDRKGFNDYLELSKVLDDSYIIMLIGKNNYDGVLPSNIIMIPPTDSAEELALYYSMADVYLNLSKGETFGKAAAEAISCGTPVIAINNTANPEIVPTGGGIVINSTDPGAIISALESVTQKNKASYTEVCVQYAKEHFDRNENIEQYIDVYRELKGAR